METAQQHHPPESRFQKRGQIGRHTTMATRSSSSSMTGEDIEELIAEHGGDGEYEIAPDDTAPVQRWQFPRFDGAEFIGTCDKKGTEHEGVHIQVTGGKGKCKDFAPDPGNMYLSRSGSGPYGTDVETIAGWLDAPRNVVGAVFLQGDPGTGKLLPMETPIPTPTGWTTMGQIKTGDYVFGRDGKPTRVVFTSQVEETPDLYDLTFSDGSVITACADHQWVVSSRRDRIRGTERVVKTSDMLGSVRLSDRINWSVRVAAPLDLPEVFLPVDPYVLGAWLGDGSTSRDGASITSMDGPIINAVEAAGYRVTSRHQQPNNQATTYRFDGLSHDLWLAEVGNGRVPFEEPEHLRTGPGLGNRFAGRTKAGRADHGKHIPLAYLRASYEQRLALLQGLMDTDGTISVSGNCEIALSDETLALGVLDLIHTLGIKAKITVEPSAYRNKAGEKVTCKDRHRIHFTTTQPVFRLDRKAARVRSDARSSTALLYIESIKPVDTRPGKCIQVDNEDSTYLCGENYIPTHNTALVEAAVCQADRTLTTVVCTPDHTKDSLFLRFVGEGHGDCVTPGHIDGETCALGCNLSPFTLGPIPYAAKHGHTLYCDEVMLLVDGLKPILYSLSDGRRFLPEGNINGSPLEIHPDFRLIMSSNPLVRGASLPEPLASRCASTTLTVETDADMLLDLGIAEDVVAAWEALGTNNLFRPAIRELRLADYWLPIDPAQAVSAFVPEHCPESERKAVTAMVVTHLGGQIRDDGRLVVK